MMKMKGFVKLRNIFPKRLCPCRLPTLNDKKKGTRPEMDWIEENEDQIDIDKEFMPHLWSSKYATPEEVMNQYMEAITTGSETATNSIPHTLDVGYGNSISQKLDIFGTDLPDHAAILVYIYGGFWKQISKDISRYPAVPLHKAGIKTIIVGYDQSESAELWDIVSQVEDALIYVLKYAEEKRSRGVYLAGHNSGAHLIATVLANFELLDSYLCKKLNGVCLISGLYDLRNFCLASANDVLNLRKIDAISSSPLDSVYSHLEHSNARFYILAAEEDSPTFKSQSRKFYDLLFDICPMKNMYFEIRSNTDHYEIVKCLTSDDNYLKKLILHDLQKHS